jgi:threonine/homoserine/homoserine lactone efflux protein
MDITLLMRGILIGLSIAAPVGPIGALAIRRTLANGRLNGFVTGMGAATADGLYGLVGAFGLTAITGFLTSNALWLQLVGGAFLCYLGVKTVLSKPSATVAPSAEKMGMLGAYTSTLLLTLTNPMTILSFVGVFAGMNISAGVNGYNSAALVVLGVFLGSALWWLLLSGAASLLRHKLNANLLAWVNRISGLVVLGFGLVALATLQG